MTSLSSQNQDILSTIGGHYEFWSLDSQRTPHTYTNTHKHPTHLHHQVSSTPNEDRLHNFTVPVGVTEL